MSRMRKDRLLDLRAFNGPKAREFTPQEIEEVETLAGFGNRVEDIAIFLGCSESCLRNNEQIRNAIEKGRIVANNRVAKSLFQKATEDKDTSSMIFWLKTRARWRESDQSDDMVSAIKAAMLERIPMDRIVALLREKNDGEKDDNTSEPIDTTGSDIL